MSSCPEDNDIAEAWNPSSQDEFEPARQPVSATDSVSSPPDGLPHESLATGISILLVLTIMQRGIGLVRSVLFCRWMTDEQLGMWSLAYSFLLIAAPFAVLGLPGCFGRYVERFRREGQLGVFLRRVGIVCGASTTAAVLALLVGGESLRWFLFRSHDARITGVIAITLLFVIVSNALIELMTGLRQVRLASVMRFVSSLVFAICSFALILAQVDGAFAAIFGFAAGALASILIASGFLWRFRSPLTSTDRSVADRRFWAMLVPFAAWLWLMDLLSNLIEVSDRYMLLHFARGDSQAAQALVGQYHSSLVIPMILVGLATMVAGALLPHLTQDWEAQRYRAVGQRLMSSLKMMLLAFTGIAAASLLAAPLLYDVLLQGRYEAGSQVLPYAFIYCIWLGAAYVCLNYLWCAEKGKWANVGMVCAVLINVGMNLLLVPRWGLMGAVVATGIANLGLLIVTLIVAQRFGLRVERTVFILIGLPLLLIAGGAPALIGIAALIGIRPLRHRLFVHGELQWVGQRLQQNWKRVRRYLPRKFWTLPSNATS